VASAELDGVAVDPDAIPVLDDGRAHKVVATLGDANTRVLSSPAATTTTSGSPVP